MPMGKTDLVKEVAKKAGVTQKDADKCVNAFLETVEEQLAKKDKVSITGFGTFESRKRQARKGRNPQTGKEMKIPAKHVPAFRPGKKLKEKVEK